MIARSCAACARLTDAAAFADLVRDLQENLRSIARGFAGDEDEVKDLVQETWARVYLRRGQYRGTGTLRRWVVGACWNVCRQHVRDHARQRRLLRHAPADALLSDHRAAPEPLGDPLMERVRGIWVQLSARQQEVVLQHVCQDLPLSVIAGRLQLAPATVRSDLFRCRRMFRAALREGARRLHVVDR